MDPCKVTHSAAILALWVTFYLIGKGKMKKPRATKTGNETSIVGGALYFEDARQCLVDSEIFPQIIGDGTVKAIRVESLNVEWLLTEWVTFDAKIESTVNVSMTLRREIRSGRGHWYAYRRVGGVLFKRYVGNDDAITQTRILTVARALPGI